MLPIEEEEEEPGFFQQHWLKFVAVGVVFAIYGAYSISQQKETPKKKTSSITMVNIAPPAPPPPPPPPPKERPPEPEVQEQKFQAEEQPDESPDPEPQADPGPDLGTGIVGDGPPDGFGLSNRGSGRIGGGKSKSGSKFGRYAGQVQARVAEVLRSNKKTKTASLSIQVKIWADATGRVTRSVLAGSTGDKGLDQAITNEILAGLQLSEPPPQDMPMPIVMRITAKRPN